MSFPIVIQGTTVDFPSSSQAPNWAPAVIQFAQLVATALNAVVGPYDISPQLYNIDAFDVVTNQPIPGLSFNPLAVRSAVIRYDVFRQATPASTHNAAESGFILVQYNPNNAVNQKWEFIQSKVGKGINTTPLTSANITFSVTDVGQFRFSTTTIGGASHTGKIAFAAQALVQS